MRLEYFDSDFDSDSPSPVLLAYGDDRRDAATLRRAVDGLAAGGAVHEVRVDEMPGFQAVDGCSLVLSAGIVDCGVEPIDGSDRVFRCVLTPATWRRVWGLLEPFENDIRPGVFQWLSEEGPIEWIISGDRGW